VAPKKLNWVRHAVLGKHCQPAIAAAGQLAAAHPNNMNNKIL
jgi:hypothetical protein